MILLMIKTKILKGLRGEFKAGGVPHFKAVYQGFVSNWSNGSVEGQVNRLKNIKRQMYGRASFELL